MVLHGGYVRHPVVLRPALVYGPGVSGNLEKMIEAVRQGRFPPLPETGNRRSMVHADDLISAAITAAREPRAAGRIYIVADNAPCSTREMFEWVCGALGKPVPRFQVPLSVLWVLGLAGDAIGRLRGRRFIFDSDALGKLTGDAWYSSQRLQRELAWTPVHTFRDAIGAIVRAQSG